MIKHQSQNQTDDHHQRNTDKYICKRVAKYFLQGRIRNSRYVVFKPDELSLRRKEIPLHKSEIEKEREKVVQQRLAFEAGVETRTDSDSVEGKIQNFLLQKMDFTEHYVDRDIISQFVDTVIPRSETCYEWYMDFDLIEKPNEKKKMVWSFKIDYNEAKTYRKEREGMLRPNQWEDLIVRVYI